MADNISSEQYRSEIAMLNHEIYELSKQLEKKNREQAELIKIDKNNPFDNPTEYTDYNGDYTEIVPQAAIPGCILPVEPNKTERKRIRRFYTIGGTSMLAHFVAINLISTVIIGLIMLILQFKNPDASYDQLYNYASSSSIMIALSTIIYLFSNVGFALMGLKWSKTPTSSLIKTKDFCFSKAAQYCLSAMFIHYAASLFSLFFSDVFGKYGFSTDVIDDSNFARTGIGIAITFIYSCIIAPVTEEFFFRGMLLKTFSRANQRFAIVASSIFFGLAHGNIPQFLLAFLLGMFLSHITMKHNSIIPSIIVHVFLNTIATVFNEITFTSNNQIAGFVLEIIYMLMVFAGLIMFVEFALKNKIPATTPHQSRRGFVIAATSVPLIASFFIQTFFMFLLILTSK